MTKRTCKCLNIVLNITGADNEDVNGTDLLDVPGEGEIYDAFFKGNLTLVKLAFAGIEVQQKLLVKERTVGDYKIYRCINCATDTHSVHKFKGLERVVANKDLLSEVSYEKIRKSTGYSPLFKVVLFKVNGDDGKRQEDSGSHTSMFQKSLSDAKSKVKDIVRKYLQSEEEAMQERIRIFTEQQKDMFHKTEAKANADMQDFIRIIQKKEETALQFSISDAMKDAKLTRGDSIDSDAEEPSPDLPHMRSRKSRPLRSIPIMASSAPTNRIPSRVLSSKPAASLDGRQRSDMKRRSRSQSEDDTLFDLDGFQEHRSCEPFFESDDDSSGESSSLDNSGGYMNTGRGNVGDRIYATSVPVSVPMYRPTVRGFFENRSYEDSEPPPSPDRMAESIKALARSLHDSTSIFGELPGPRYNTMPYH